jgi:LEA14-like dessication related protein
MSLGSVFASLTSSNRQIALVALLIVGGVVGGAVATGALGVPSVAAMDNSFGDVTNETTAVETDLVISNPNPVGIGLDGVSVNYTVSMNDIDMAQGGREGVIVDSGNSTLALETDLRNDAIPPWWVSHIRNGERTTVDIDASVTADRLGRTVGFSRSREIQTDLLGEFNSDETRPVNADSALTSDPVLYVNETRGEWGSVSESETLIEMAFTVYNPNLEPYAVTEIGYDVTMNGIEMASGQTAEGYVIPSRSTETIEFTTALQNRRLDEWWVTHLDDSVHGHQVSDLTIEFYAVIEIPTGEEITVPLDALTYEETIETDIFDEGDDVRAADGADEPDATENETDADGGETDGDESTSGENSTGGGSDNGSTTTDGGSDDDGIVIGDGSDGNDTAGDGSDDDGIVPF